MCLCLCCVVRHACLFGRCSHYPDWKPDKKKKDGGTKKTKTTNTKSSTKKSKKDKDKGKDKDKDNVKDKNEEDSNGLSSPVSSSFSSSSVRSMNSPPQFIPLGRPL